MHDDHYVLVDHDLVVHDVIVVSVTGNGQFIYRFQLFVTDNDMMATNSYVPSFSTSSSFVTV